MYDERGDLLETYRAAPVVLGTLLRGVDAARARERPTDGDWSVVEVVAHLGDAEELAFGRVRRMVDEDDPLLPAYDQEALATEHRYRDRSLDEAFDRFTRLRAEQRAFLEALDEAGWARTGRHEEVGEISVRQLTAHMAAHDAAHLAQIARLLT